MTSLNHLELDYEDLIIKIKKFEPKSHAQLIITIYKVLVIIEYDDYFTSLEIAKILSGLDKEIDKINSIGLVKGFNTPNESAFYIGQAKKLGKTTFKSKNIFNVNRIRL